MTKQTLHFQYDPMELAKQILIIYFESELKAFDTSLLSHGNYEIKYETPVFIREAVYDALENISDYKLNDFMTQVAKFYDITDEFKFDLYLPQIFEKIIESEYFLEILEKYHQKHPVFDSYVKDLTSGIIYKAKYTCHYETIIAIISQHPELDTPEKQDDFVMTQLKLVGESYNQDWYKPKYFVVPKEDNSKLYQYDVQAAFNRVYTDALIANKTEKPEPSWNIVIDDYENNKFINKIIKDKSKVIKYLVKYNVLKKAQDFEPEFFTDDIEDIINFVQSDSDLINIKSYDAELVELKPTYDTIRYNREELIIYKDWGANYDQMHFSRYWWCSEFRTHIERIL